MNKLAISALLFGGLFQATGCIITTNDDGSSFDVAWSVNGGCPTNAAAEIISMDTLSGEMFKDVYNCADGRGVTSPLPLGDYDVWVEITDDQRSITRGQSLATAVSLDFDGDIVAVDVPPFDLFAGFFGFTWTLVDSAGNPETCANVFSGGVDVISTLADTNEALVDVFNCEDGSATTNGLLLGLYTVVVDILDEADEPLGTSVPREESLVTDQEVVDLGNFEFTF